MIETSMDEITICPTCGRSDVAGLRTQRVIPAAIIQLIHAEKPEWTEADGLCLNCLNRYRTEYVNQVLRSDEGDLDVIEKLVTKSFEDAESSAFVEDLPEALTFGNRLADKVAAFGGSWAFIIFFGCVIVVWITLNTFALAFRFDPFPYILLNLVLSCLAAMQAPVIMMSQNRQEAKDRIRAERDYRTNLKAELEIRKLHDKIDHLLTRQMKRLMEVQVIQVEMMSERITERS